MECRGIAFLLFFSYFVGLFHPSIASINGRKEELNVYIVLVRGTGSSVSRQNQYPEIWHNSLLSTVIANDSSRLVYSYDQVVNGFAARLTKQEVKALSNQDWFVDAIPSGKYKLLTTHSQTFLGLRNSKADPHGVWATTNMGEGVIIGILDSGITPGHPSFKDEGLPPPPAKWKGHCDFNSSVCNNKLIGARRILSASKKDGHVPPVDTEGHGTHVASTAAGAFVQNAGVFGSAVGIASGSAPRAHLAFYQVCGDSTKECEGADIIKAIETAVDDGVDVISLSMGLGTDDGISKNVISIGAFHAILRGVFVSCAAGNSGPHFSSVDNDFPWVLTVGASTTDRRIAVTVKLGNGLELNAETPIQPKRWKNNMLPLVWIDSVKDLSAKNKIKGKIVICNVFVEPFELERILRTVEAAGLIIPGMNTPLKFPIPVPSAFLSADGSKKIKDYIISSSENATATLIFEGTTFNAPNSPRIGFFSARGPSSHLPRILKPDIVGPGVDILGAFPPSVKSYDSHNESAKFVFMSGTSMSTPHLSGIAALLKKAHPDWSPAAIKSAIMTTASPVDRDGNRIIDERDLPADLYTTGAGHVDPKRAMDPGLVYDIKPKEYIPFLCGLGLSNDQIRPIISPLPPVSCSKVKPISQEQLNYPSIVATLKFNSTVTIRRRVINVGHARSTYSAKLDIPDGLSVHVVPEVLDFKRKNETKSFAVIFKWIRGKAGYVEGELKWISKNHVVRSPIVMNKALRNGSTLLPYNQPEPHFS